MYPNLYELFLDLFGVSIPPLKMMQSYGTMVACGFIFASVTLTLELKRKEKEGLLKSTFKKVWEGKPSSTVDKVLNSLISFLIGFKLLPLLTSFDLVFPRIKDFMLSGEGNWLAGVLMGGGMLGYMIYDDRKHATDKPKEVEKEVHPNEHVGNMVILAAIGGIGGAKLFHNLENIDEMMADPIGALTSFSGLSFFGGLLCAAAMIIYYAHKHKIKALHLVDAAVPGLAMAYGFGRMGCQIAGDGDWGIPNDRPMPDWLSWLPEWLWRYDYPNNVLDPLHRGKEFMIDYFARQGYESLTGYAYPTPLYEIIMSIIIFSFLWGMRKRLKTPGVMASWYLLLIGTERLLIEQIRINNEYPILGGITQAEIISAVIILAGAVGLYYMPKVGQRWAKW
ncbi:MAG: diacylglyceryl transferase [Flavobacteriales bacterium]|nr:diacylglyceryl transferase [Flavobacteriales bacterium]